MDGSPTMGRFREIALALALAVSATGTSVEPAASVPAPTAPGPAVRGERNDSPPVPQKATPAVGLMFPGGPGHPGPVYAGTWRNGRVGFCIDFARHSPMNAGTDLITGPLPGMTVEQSARVKFLANTYAGTTSDRTAARAQFAIWAVEGEPEFRKWYAAATKVTKADRKAVRRMLADAALHGPYRMQVRVEPVVVGQTGTGTVTLLAANGKPAVGRRVRVGAHGADILTVRQIRGDAARTTARGLAFTYRRTEPGKVRFAAELVVPSSRSTGLSVTDDPHQRTVSGGYVERAVASTDYESVGEGAELPRITTRCDTDCDGTGTVTFSVCNPAGADPVRWTHRVGGRVVATLDAADGACATRTAALADGDRVTSSSCYLNRVGGPCSTPATTAPGAYEVVCPPWPTATYELPCACPGGDGGVVAFTGPPRTVRGYRGVVTVTTGGRTWSKEADIPRGSPARIELGPLPEGGTITISFVVFTDERRTTRLAGPHDLRRVTLAAPGD